MSLRALVAMSLVSHHHADTDPLLDLAPVTLCDRGASPGLSPSG